MSIHNLSDVLDAGPDRANRIALIDLSGETARDFTVAALDALVNAVARALAARFSPGFRVAIVAQNSAEFLAVYLGAMRGGGVAMPLSVKLAPDMLAEIVREAKADIVFADGALALPPDLPLVRMNGADWSAFLDPGPCEPAAVGPIDVAQILFTSGSTGRPKGVPLTHTGQAWAVEKAASFIDDAPSYRVLVAAPMFHMNALFNIKRSLYGGSSVVLLPRFTAQAYRRAIELYRADWITCVPTMMAMLAREIGKRSPPEFLGVRRIFMSSSSFSPQLFATTQAMFPRAAILNSYGTTEAGPHVFEPHPEGLPSPPMSVGCATPGGMVRLVDGERRTIEGPGEGVLEMNTPATMPGYLDRPDLTAPVLRDAWYHSRDVMRRDQNGFYFFVSRSDDMFTCGGENIYPIEVEQVLEKHPDVEQAIVVAVPDETKQSLPFAFVVRAQGSDVSEATLKKWFLGCAPAYMHPRGIAFLAEAPLGQTNKIDRASLTARAHDLLQRDER